MNTITVKMGNLAAAHNDAVIDTHGIGSCAVVILYDPIGKVGGLCHAMMPGKAEDTKKGNANPFRYVETAIDGLIKALEKIGGKKERFKAKLIGGAQMFTLYTDKEGGSIGDRNIASAKQKLKLEGIPITNQETGGNTGRSVSFDTTDGTCAIETKM